ncbi:MAG: helix-turn-helix transcriptional regulator [Clostridia bacterium]|nr:helix-turn-helix transcriptional regulator [Clostridia bacterium]
MLIQGFHEIGDRLLAVRKKRGLTQMQVAELAGVADRTYADIERGTANMRIDTLQRICKALRITPDEILTESSTNLMLKQEELLQRLNTCSEKERQTALSLLDVYLHSLE